MKIKNILKGYQSKYEISQVTFFEGDSCLYSGAYDNFIHTSIKDIVLYNEMKRILDTEAVKIINHNNSKLFIFLKENENKESHCDT